MESRFGGIPVEEEEIPTSKFGGIPVEESEPKSKFGGVPVNETEPAGAWDKTKEVVRSITKGPTEFTGDVLQSLGEVLTDNSPYSAFSGGNIISGALKGSGKYVSDAAEQVLPGEKRLESSVLYHGIPTAIGQLPGYLAAGETKIPGAIAALMGTVGYKHGIDSAPKDATPEEKVKYGLAFAAVEAGVGSLLPFTGKYAAQIAGMGEGITPTLGKYGKYVAANAVQQSPLFAAQQASENLITGKDIGEGVVPAVETALPFSLIPHSEPSKGEKIEEHQNVTPEAPTTLQTQQSELVAGKRPAMLFTPGETELPVPEGFKRVETPAGIFHFDPNEVTKKEIHQSVANDEIGKVLDYGIDAKPEDPSLAVVRRDAQGNEIEAVATDEQNKDKVIEKQQERQEPDQTVSVEDPAKVIQERDQATTPDKPTSLKRSVVDKELEELDLPALDETERQSNQESVNKANAIVEKDPDAPRRLVQSLTENPRPIKAEEVALVLRRQVELRNQRAEAMKAEAEAKTPLELQEATDRLSEIREELQKGYETGKLFKAEQGRGLQALKMLMNKDFSIEHMEAETRSIVNKGKPLSEKQITSVRKLHERIKAAEDQLSAYEARDKFNNELAQAKKEKAKGFSVQDFLDQQAEAARQRIKNRFARTSADITLGTGILADHAIIGASHLSRGITKFSHWSAKMIEEFGDKIKPHLKDLFSRSQELNQRASSVSRTSGQSKESFVLKMRATVLKNQIEALTKEIETGEKPAPKPPVPDNATTAALKEKRNELKKELEKIHPSDPQNKARVTRLTHEINDLQKQIETGERQKEAPQKPYSKEAAELKLRRDELKKELDRISPPEEKESNGLASDKKRISSRIEDLVTKTKEGDFSKPEKKAPRMDKEKADLLFEYSKAKEAYTRGLFEAQLRQQTIPQKVFRGGKEVINLGRAIITSFDLPPVFRQGGFMTLSHPIRSLKALPDAFRAMASERGQHRVMSEIAARPNAPLYARAKLALTEHGVGARLDKMEEAYMSRWARRIPGVAHSERAYSTFLNRLRADSFDAMMEGLGRNGKVTSEEARSIAHFVNAATGRGDIGALAKHAETLNTFFFSPRNLMSRLQLITGQPMWKGNARTRTLIAKEYGRYLIGLGVVYGLAQMAGAEIEDDPRSSDFGKLKFGNTRLDPLSGLQQITVLASREYTGETKSLSGKVRSLTKAKPGPYDQNRLDVAGRFLRTKLAPVPGAVLNLGFGRDVVGNKTDAENEALNMITPISPMDVMKAIESEGVPAGTALGLISLWGMGMQTIPPK